MTCPTCERFGVENCLVHGRTTDDATVVKELYDAWKDWSATHDVRSAKLACCVRTDRLFTALEAVAKLLEE